MTASVRVGAGTGFAGDRYEPAVELARSAALDALVFECLAERTIALAQQRRRGGGVGFDERILRRLRDTLPVLAPAATVVTNAGAADPLGAAAAVASLCAQLGISRTVHAVTGDDVLDALPPESVVLETGRPVAELGDRVVSANAYLGADALLPALESGADVVVTGRAGDAALFLAPLAHRHGWDLADPATTAAGVLVGHLLECAGQITGGYHADGARKDVPGLARLGFPYAEVDERGDALISKVPGTGGAITRRTVLEQLLYEVDDPARYLTPDAIVDFTGVRIAEEDGAVRVSGAAATGVPSTLKVSVGIRDGWLAVAEIGYAGEGCLERGRLADAIVRERWQDLEGRDPAELRVDLVGWNGMRPWHRPVAEPAEVRVRWSLRTPDEAPTTRLLEEVEALYTNGPYGGGGVTGTRRQTTGVVSTLIPRERVSPRVTEVGP